MSTRRSVLGVRLAPMTAWAKATILAGLLVILAGCGTSSSSTASPSGSSRPVTRATFQGTWPFTVDHGILGCDPSIGTGAVGFNVDGHLYGVNGFANPPRYSDVKPIWKKDPASPGLRITLGDMISQGLKLCNA